MKRFGDLVRQAMERQGLKELGLAKKAKFGQGYLNRVLSGKSTPTFYKVLDLCRALEVKIDYFIPPEYDDVGRIPQNEAINRECISEVIIDKPSKLLVFRKDYVRGDDE